MDSWSGTDRLEGSPGSATRGPTPATCRAPSRPHDAAAGWARSRRSATDGWSSSRATSATGRRRQHLPPLCVGARARARRRAGPGDRAAPDRLLSRSSPAGSSPRGRRGPPFGTRGGPGRRAPSGARRPGRALAHRRRRAAGSGPYARARRRGEDPGSSPSLPRRRGCCGANFAATWCFGSEVSVGVVERPRLSHFATSVPASGGQLADRDGAKESDGETQPAPSCRVSPRSSQRRPAGV